jgi:hypothetical protein
MNGLPSFGGDKPQNPARVFLRWAGKTDKGVLTYWDKKNETEVSMPKDFTFIVLDQLNQVGGYSDEEQSSFYSNAVRNTNLDTLTVRLNGQIVAEGTWKEIASDIKARGAKFVKGIYIGYKDDDGLLQIGHIAAQGSFLSEWFDFTKVNAAKSGAVQIAGTEQRTKGATEYLAPIFKARPLDDGTYKDAVELSNQVQNYLTEYFAYNQKFDSTAPQETTEDEEAKAIAADANSSSDPFAGSLANPADDHNAPEEEEIPW